MISRQDFSDAEHQIWLNHPATQLILQKLLDQREKILLRASIQANNPQLQELVCRLELVKAHCLEQVVKSLRENKYENL